MVLRDAVERRGYSILEYSCYDAEHFGSRELLWLEFVCFFLSFFLFVLTYYNINNYNPESLSLETKRSRNTIIMSWHST